MAAEHGEFVHFAALMDDGEARSAAAAHNRGLTIVTGDRVTRRAARDHILAISSLTPPEFMKLWSEGAVANPESLAEAMRRIEICAWYRPRRAHPLTAWWESRRIVP